MAAIQLVVAIAALTLAISLGRVVYDGLRAGRIRHTDSVQTFQRSNRPIAYWLTVLLLSGLAVLALFAAADMSMRLMHRTQRFVSLGPST